MYRNAYRLLLLLVISADYSLASKIEKGVPNTIDLPSQLNLNFDEDDISEISDPDQVQVQVQVQVQLKSSTFVCGGFPEDSEVILDITGKKSKDYCTEHSKSSNVKNMEVTLDDLSLSSGKNLKAPMSDKGNNETIKNKSISIIKGTFNPVF